MDILFKQVDICFKNATVCSTVADTPTIPKFQSARISQARRQPQYPSTLQYFRA